MYKCERKNQLFMSLNVFNLTNMIVFIADIATCLKICFLFPKTQFKNKETLIIYVTPKGEYIRTVIYFMERLLHYIFGSFKITH